MDEAVSIGKEENWERISAHYAPMLFNEYLACVVAAGSVTTRLQSDMLKNWQTDCKEFTDILNRKRAALVSAGKRLPAVSGYCCYNWRSFWDMREVRAAFLS